MIRASGIVAVLSSITILAVLWHRTGSAEIAGTVVEPPDWVSRPKSGPRVLYLRLPKAPEKSELAAIGNAYLAVITIADLWGFEFSAEAADAAQIGDEVGFRLKVLRLNELKLEAPVVHLRTQVRGRVISVPGNRRFVLVTLVGALLPVTLWALSAGIAAAAGSVVRRRRARLTPPSGSPEN